VSWLWEWIVKSEEMISIYSLIATKNFVYHIDVYHNYGA